MKTLICLTACLFLALGIGFGQSACLQDQYGNQYNFTVNTATNYVYGSVTNAQGCSGGTWPLIGSYVVSSTGTALELTASNPLGDTDGCVSAYMLKGVLPNFQWYYDLPSSNPQPGTWTSCGTALSGKPTGKGSLK